MKHILLVEDDPTIASGLMYAFEKEGYEAIHCKDIKSALAKIEIERFHLAILDMQLPDGSGILVSEKLGDAVNIETVRGMGYRAD